MAPFVQDEEDMVNRKRSNQVQRKIASRKPLAKVDHHVEEQFLTGRLLGNALHGLCGGWVWSV